MKRRGVRLLVGWFVGLALIAGAASASGSSGSSARPAAASATTWTLVTASCGLTETQEGVACFDPMGHASEWESVSDSSATSNTDNGTPLLQYTYTLPQTIGAGESDELKLDAVVSMVTSSAGDRARVCATLPFSTDVSEPCATTADAYPFYPGSPTMQEDSTTLTLLPSSATSGTTVDVTIGFESPGGQVRFTYKASSQSPPPNPKKLQVEFLVKSFSPAKATVASGARITICNASVVFAELFSASKAAQDSTLVKVGHYWRIRGTGPKGRLKPGECSTFTVRNPTPRPMTLSVYDLLHTRAKLKLTIEPESH